MRLTWADLPAHVHAEIEARLGARVVEAVSHSAGFSPGLASRLRTADGADVFVKAVSGVATPHSVDIHRREARIAAALPADVRGTATPVVVRRRRLGRARVRLRRRPHARTPVAVRRPRPRARARWSSSPARSTPSPIATETAEEVFGDALRQWRTFPDDPVDLARLAPPWQRRLDELVELESQWAEVDAAVRQPAAPRRARRQPAAHRRPACTSPTGRGPRPARRGSTSSRSCPSVAMQGGPDPESGAGAPIRGVSEWTTRRSTRSSPPSPGSSPATRCGRRRRDCRRCARSRRRRASPHGPGSRNDGAGPTRSTADVPIGWLAVVSSRCRRVAARRPAGHGPRRPRPLGDLVGARTADEDVHERDGRERDTDPHRGVPSVHERLARRVRDRRAVASERGRGREARSRCLPSRRPRGPDGSVLATFETPER